MEKLQKIFSYSFSLIKPQKMVFMDSHQPYIQICSRLFFIHGLIIYKSCSILVSILNLSIAFLKHAVPVIYATIYAQLRT
jgi:hypothetical protein